MSLQITQETFDNTVRENITEFEMSVEEAIKETIEQFKTQGVDLSHIVTDWMMAGSLSSPALVDAIIQLDNLAKGSPADPVPIIRHLTIIRTECDKGLSSKVLAGKEGAYNVIMRVSSKLESNIDVKECLNTLIVLVTQHPDLLDDQGVSMIIKFLDNQEDLDVLKLTLKWIKECCTLHEINMPLLIGRLKCMQLAIIHDLPECIVGDIIPDDPITLEEKHKLEQDAIEKLTSLLGSSSDVGKTIYNTYVEYREQKTPEAKFVKDLDKFDMIFTAALYEKRCQARNSLQEFFDCTAGKFQHPFVQKLAKGLEEYRENMFSDVV